MQAGGSKQKAVGSGKERRHSVQPNDTDLLGLKEGDKFGLTAIESVRSAIAPGGPALIPTVRGYDNFGRPIPKSASALT
jgi:hypothetical protein